MKSKKCFLLTFASLFFIMNMNAQLKVDTFGKVIINSGSSENQNTQIEGNYDGIFGTENKFTFLNILNNSNKPGSYADLTFGTLIGGKATSLTKIGTQLLDNSIEKYTSKFYITQKKPRKNTHPDRNRLLF